MTTDHVFYSSVTLGFMGGLAIILAIVFRLKNRSLGRLPKNLSPSIFNKTFAVFDPYPDQKKSLHTFLVALPFVVFFASFGLLLLGWKMLESGLILSVFITIIGINMILVEEAPEVYANSKTFVEAIRTEAELAPGDLRALQLTQKAARKLSNYYFGLSILLIALGTTLPYIITLSIQLLVTFLDLIVKSTGWAGIIGWQIAILILAVTFVMFQILASRVKDKILTYKME